MHQHKQDEDVQLVDLESQEEYYFPIDAPMDYPTSIVNDKLVFVSLAQRRLIDTGVDGETYCDHFVEGDWLAALVGEDEEKRLRVLFCGWWWSDQQIPHVAQVWFESML